ncbi:MAG: hypothetical protein MJ228_01070 [Bacilli bacterium]|nr:hypothetical protein [Bacilli bacterium]
MAEYKVPEYIYETYNYSMNQGNIWLSGKNVSDTPPAFFVESVEGFSDKKVKVPESIKTKEDLIRFVLKNYTDDYLIQIDGKLVLRKDWQK